MTGVARFCLLATVAFVMVSPGAIAFEGGDSLDIISEESTTCVYNLDSLDVEDLRARAEEGTPIAWNVLGRTVQYTPVVVAIEGDDARSMASQLDPRSAKAYVGVDANGADDVRMTVASDWVHVYFLIDNVEYMIDRMDGADGSDCYYVHSSYDAVAMAQYSDLFDEVVPDPSEQTRPSSEILPSDVKEANSSSPLALSSTQSPVPADVSASPVEESECDNRTTVKGLGGDPVYRIASVICAADEEFRALYPNDWQDRILAVMNDMSGRYESQVLISFRICMYLAVDLPSENANALMDDFELLMDTDPNLWYVNRDLAHLFTGKDLLDDDGGNGVMGIAYVAGVRRA
ncbi:MAG TPA: M12 family metallo-peptidase, partial [Thermoplasmata archaeon]